ncbi:MAG: processive 1,2-diacylglycerol beta-glucosyltransferase [Phycisphaerales bacterium]|jgi:processive 1,2-diacylglycerol beta-glucosyltransferase|nr:processive 1,2-diacylglycerol beta-glucosyltransferase [Phycisphaerales bacterium]
MPARVLVLSASVGAGHLRAAQAVELALRESAPDATVKNVDVLTLTNAPFRKLYGEAYLDLVNKAPHVLGFFYDHMDKARRPDSKRDKLRLLVERLNMTSLCDLLECEQWDVIVNTHFMPAEIIASMRKRKKFRTPQMTVTTDFETHRLWVNQPCDHYTTATDEGAAYLHHWGVPSADISVTGIPIHPVFAKPKTRDAAMKRQGITGGRPVLLQLAGGFGVGPVAEIFESILKVETPIELIVVTGKNAAAKKKLEAAKIPKQHRVKVLGFTDQMDDLMAAADVVISKPGGLTTSETLARGAAMVVVNPIPGQESRNSDYLLENGAAIKINNLPTLAMKLSALLAEPKRLQQLRDNAKRLGRPQAAFDVAARALRLAGAGVGV